jgi:hypothetical protein
MQKISGLGLLLAATTTLGLLSVRCGTAAPDPNISTGGVKTTGGEATATGGASTGGVVETGGTSTGGIATGGTSTGGTVDTGGTSTGGSSTGGTTGGTATGGASGSSTGGGAGASGGGNGGASGGGNGGASGGASGGQAGGGNGGVGGGGAGGTGPVSAFKQVATILDTHCGVCHYGGSAVPLKVNLRDDATLYMRLTTTITSAVAAKCNTRILVDKTTPTNSLLSQVLKTGGVNDTANNCVIPQMPKDSVLSPADIQTINDWINSGAPQQ